MKIKAENTIYNDSVLVQCSPESGYALAIFRPEEKPQAWNVEIQYDTVNDESVEDKVEGKIILTNENFKDEKIEFLFVNHSTVSHYEVSDGSFDTIYSEVVNDTNPEDAFSVDVGISYGEDDNPIVTSFIIHSRMNKVSNNPSFIDYSHLKIQPTSMFHSLTQYDVSAMTANLDICDTDFIFTTDYYYNDNVDFNPWNS